MKIDILCPDPGHPAWIYLRTFAHISKSNLHDTQLHHELRTLRGGDILFAVGCSHRIEKPTLDLYRHTLIPHGSDLPEGRGWSPVIHEIRMGRETFTISVVEANDGPVDTGPLWGKIRFCIPRDADFRLVNHIINSITIDAINRAIAMVESGDQPVPQEPFTDLTPTSYPRLTMENSEINPHFPLADQFDRLRSCDPNRFPAIIRFRGRRYKLTLEDLGADHAREETVSKK